MPVPMNMELQLDIWTSNYEQKLQLFEQIIVLFNPTLDIQSNTNPLDWSSLTYLEHTDTTWTSRTVPVGTENPIDIMSLNFQAPIWINPPAKIQKQTVIHQIVTNIVEFDTDCFGENGTFYDEGDLLGRIITTPKNHQISVSGNEVTLLTEGGATVDENNNLLNWQTLLDQYGNFRSQVTQLRIKRYAANIDTEVGDIVGTIELHPTETNKLLWTPDISTLPANTLTAINAIIDPRKTFPSGGLPLPVSGQRYLLTGEIGGQDGPNGEDGSTVGWGSLVADVNDIVEYNGSAWVVSFDASETTTQQFVLNNATSKQLVWDDGDWLLAIDGTYRPSIWRLYF